jgi:hypothetical protein
MSTPTCHPGRALSGSVIRHEGAIRDPLGSQSDVEVGPGFARCPIPHATVLQTRRAALGRDDRFADATVGVTP